MFIGIGTMFWADGDPQNPNSHLACYHRALNDKKDFIVAHRTLPCNTEVVVCNIRTNECVKAKVADRGPYGKTKHKGTITYTSVIDLSKRVAKAIHFNGKESVLVYVISSPPSKKKILYERTNS
jgi:rare lipoprotein A